MDLAKWYITERIKDNQYVIAAMVDYMARRGWLQNGLDLIHVIWGSLLSGSIKHKDQDMARLYVMK